MQSTHHPIIWHELLTQDITAAAEFYGNIIGLDRNEPPSDNLSLSILSAAGHSVAAIVDFPLNMTVESERSRWVSYVWVDHLDTAIAGAIKLGSILKKPAIAIAGVGRSAILEDPQGAIFGLFAPEGEGPRRSAGSEKQPGHAVWHELYADDPEAALAFYSKLFGWKKGPSIPMGPAGDYQVFAVDEVPTGGMMKRPKDFGQVLWNPFFQVADIIAAQGRIKALKGTIFDGLRQVPDGDWTLKCIDPRGATFALSGPKI